MKENHSCCNVHQARSGHRNDDDDEKDDDDADDFCKSSQSSSILRLQVIELGTEGEIQFGRGGAWEEHTKCGHQVQEEDDGGGAENVEMGKRIK